jgi:superfamily II DNA or RNA helicase
MIEKDLRFYQRNALDNIREAFYKADKIANSEFRNLKGRIIIPTGGGKTAVEAFALKDFINKDGQDVHLVLAPRIVLLNQLIKEYRNYIGQSYIALAFHSGKLEKDAEDFKDVKWHENSTTNIAELQEEYERAKRMKKDLVVFSTYVSAEKLLGIKFDSLIADESQYCVAEGYHETIRVIDSPIKLFFTATEKHTHAEGRGLNNTAVYGEVLFKISPKELIEQGYIVEPRLHAMYAKSDKEGSTVIDEIINVAKYQHELTVKKMPYSKILFAMKGTDDVRKVVDSIKKLKEEMPTHDIFTIVSNSKYGAMVNGEKMPRGNFMKMLRESNNALVFHYDILSEGIDIDGITGVSIMRNMTKSKLLQTIGRAVRPYKAAPELKKCAWITVPVLNGDDETKVYVADIIRTMRDGGFDISYESVDFTGHDGPGIYEDEGLDDQYSKNKNGTAQRLLQDVFHDIEKDAEIEEWVGMSFEEKLANFK